MNAGGDAAEQIVRMSLEGVEVAAKITGVGAKHLAVALLAILKEENKTAGKARLSSMIKTGKELNVFSIPEKDLKKFAAEAKRYGVLYCVVKGKEKGDENAMVDLIVRMDDAPKINRIVQNFKLATVDKAKVETQVVKDKETKGKNVSKAKNEKGPRSEPSSARAKENRAGIMGNGERESVRGKLTAYKEVEKKQQSRTREQAQKAPQNKKKQIKHQQPKRKKKSRSR